ncbi:MAG: phosphoethanolamine--lipid A transferase [Pusillimonas sp.]
MNKLVSWLNIATRLSSTSIPSHTLVIAVSFWIAAVVNIPLWIKIVLLPEYDSAASNPIPFIAAFIIGITALNTLVFSLFTWGKLLRPMLTLLVLTSASTAYFMLEYGIVIDSTMITNVLQTNPNEAGDLIGRRFFLAVFLFSAVPASWIWRVELKSEPLVRALGRQILLIFSGAIIACICILLIYQPLASTMRNHKQIRYLITPLNSIYAIANLGAGKLARDDKVLIPVGNDARKALPADGAAPLLFLVLGETARAESFQLNGYARETNPYLAARTDLFFSQNAWSCGTSTADSVPCMFSFLGRDGYQSRKGSYENMLDVIRKAGLAVLWLDNQSGCKGVCARIETQSFSPIDTHVECTAEGCLDVAMLDGLKERIEALPPEQRAKGVVVVLHQMGSHGPAYYKRSSPERKPFQPECKNSALQTCNRQDVVNAYDNSIRETDFFLSQTISWLERHYPGSATSMIYASDHGESLGEANIYLHGLPYAIAPDVQKQIPWLVWMSNRMQRESRISIACMKERMSKRRISHDNYAHSVLGALGIESTIYKEGLDIFKDCRDSSERKDLNHPNIFESLPSQEIHTSSRGLA